MTITSADPASPLIDATTRGGLLSKWAELIDANAAEIGRLECLEVGHPSWGPPPMARILRFVAGQADKVSGRTMGADAVLDYTQVKTVSMRGTERAAG